MLLHTGFNSICSALGMAMWIHRSLHHFSRDWNISTDIGWISMFPFHFLFWLMVLKEWILLTYEDVIFIWHHHHHNISHIQGKISTSSRRYITFFYRFSGFPENRFCWSPDFTLAQLWGWFWVKYFDNFWIDCHEIWCRHSYSSWEELWKT